MKTKKKETKKDKKEKKPVKEKPMKKEEPVKEEPELQLITEEEAFQLVAAMIEYHGDQDKFGEDEFAKLYDWATQTRLAALILECVLDGKFSISFDYETGEPRFCVTEAGEEWAKVVQDGCDPDFFIEK